jgi:mannonate dehydratase
MKIVDASVNICSPGRNFVTLKITTEDGIYGLGDATLNGRELAVASYLSDHLIPLLIGRDARRIEDIWQYLYKGAYWRRGPVTMSAISAVDTALWDIRGKALNTPVYQLLGGASREAVMVYGHANGSNVDETVTAVKRYADLGYRSGRAQCAVPGSPPPTASAAAVSLLRAGRAGAAAGNALEQRTLHGLRADAVRSSEARVRHVAASPHDVHG